MLDKTITFDKFVRLMLGGILIAAILYIMNYLSSVLLPFFVAWLLAYLLYPTVCFVQHKLKVPGRALSIIVTMIFAIAVIGGIVYMIIPPLIEQFEKLGYLVTTYIHDTANIESIPAAIRDWIKVNDRNIQRFFRSAEMNEMLKEAMPQVFSVITRTANIILSVIASLIALIYVFFILKDYEVLAAGMIKIFPKKNRPFWRELIDDVEHELNSYVRGQSLVALCIGILFCIGYTIIGFPMAIGLGILIGFTSLVPYLHSIALIPIVMLSALKAADTGQNFWIILITALAVFLIIQLITDMVLVPKIMGKAMGLNPAILLLSLSVWGALLGFIGLIIALPLTTLLIAYYQRYVTRENEDEPSIEEEIVQITERIQEKTEKITE